MRENRPSGSIPSGDWKRSPAGSEAPALRKPPETATPIRLPPPRQSSTLLYLSRQIPLLREERLIVLLSGGEALVAASAARPEVAG